jgi:excisionase family DNA binding protein
MTDRLVTREQAAKRLGCSMRTIERMLRDGRLGAVRREDGRLSVDPEDFARVLADPGLLERRRGASSPRPPVVTAEPGDHSEAEAERPSEARLTPLDARVQPATADHSAIPRPGLEPSPVHRARRPLMAAALILAGAVAAIGFVHSTSPLRNRSTAARITTADPHTAPAPVPAASGGRASAPDMPDKRSAARGGPSTTVVVRAARPQTRRPRVTEPTPVGYPRVSPEASVTDCGFGSLTVLAC